MSPRDLAANFDLEMEMCRFNSMQDSPMKLATSKRLL